MIRRRYASLKAAIDVLKSSGYEMGATPREWSHIMQDGTEGGIVIDEVTVVPTSYDYPIPTQVS